MIPLMFQLFNITISVVVMLVIIWKDLSDPRYSVWWGVLLLLCGNKAPIQRTLRNKRYMGSWILVVGILFVTYGQISEIYAESVADKTWVWFAALGMIPLGTLLRIPFKKSA